MIKATFIVNGLGSVSAVGITIQGAAIEALKLALYQLDELMAEEKRDMISIVSQASKRVVAPAPGRHSVVRKGQIALRLDHMEKADFRAQYEVQANLWSINEGALAVV